MDKRIAHFENLRRESSTQNTNSSVIPSRTSLRRTHTALTNSSSRELKPRPLSRKNAVSFRGRNDLSNIVAEHASSRRNSEEQKIRSGIIAEESAENEVELWQFQGKHEKDENTDEALGLEDIHQDEGDEHYVVETLKHGADGPELNIVYYQVTRKTVMRGTDFRHISGRQYLSKELTLSSATAKTDSGIELDRSSLTSRSSKLVEHDYESVYLEVPDISDVKRKSSEDQKLFHIVQELISTEKNYLVILDRIVNEYKPYLETHAPVGLQGKSKYIFGNILEIQKTVREFLSCLLKKGIHDIEGIANVFLDFSSMFELYPIYCANKPTAEYYLSQFKAISAKKQEELKDSLDLSSHMITPIQRIGRYILMLGDIQKELIKQNQFSENVEKVVKIIKKEMQKGNDSIAIQSIVFCSIDLTKYGSYIMRDQFKVKSERMEKYNATVFLFDKILVFTQRSERSKNTDFEEFKYVNNIEIDHFYVRTRQEPTIIELLAKDDSLSYTLQAETNLVRDNWMDTIVKGLEVQLVEAKALGNVDIRKKLDVPTPTLSRRSSIYYSSGSGEYDEFYDAIDEDPEESKLSKLAENPNRAQANAVLEGLKKRNTASAIDSIKHCPVDLSKAGQLEMSEDFRVLKPAEFAGRIFLFEKMVVFTKIEGKNREQYIHQASINMRDLGITTLDIDSPIFHLYDSVRLRKAQGEKWRFELKAESADVKLIWTKKIEKLLTEEQRTRNHKNSSSNHVSDDDVFVNQRGVKVFNMAKEEPDNLISCATKDLISAEEKYVADLRMVVNDYEGYFDAHSSISGIIGKSSYLFGNVSSILEKTEQFLSLLRNQRKEDVEGISSVFIDMAPMFELYPEYARSRPKSDHYLREIDFILEARQEELRDHNSLATYLSKPIQRLPQYLIWLEYVQKHLKSPSLNLERAINIIKKEKKEMDDCFAIDSIKDCLIERHKYGSFIMSGQFTMQKPSKYEATVYLFENVVVFTKNDPNNIHTYMDSIEMSALHMTPFPNEPLLFHLVNFPRLQTGLVERYTFVLKSKSSKVKDTWTAKIQNMLWEQLQRAKEQQDRVSGVQINQRSTEAPRGRPPVVPPKNKMRCNNSYQP